MTCRVLSDIADIVMGQSPPGEAVTQEPLGLPLLNGPTEFGTHHPAPSQYTRDVRKAARTGDILFCVRGSTTGRMNWADREYAIGRGIAAVRHKENERAQPFVRAVIELQLPGLLAQATGSTFPNVSASQLAALPAPDIGLAEQLSIARILGALDDKIELNRSLSETLEAIAQALFQSWFVDFDPVRAKASGEAPESICRRLGLTPMLLALFPDRLVESELGEIPEGWAASVLGAVIDIFDSKRVPLSNREREQRKGEFPYYGAASVMDYVNDYLFDGVFVLTGEDGSVVNPNGTPILQYVWGKFWVNNHAHVLQAKPPMSSEQLLLFLRRTNIAALVTGAVQAKLSQANMKRIPYVQPTSAINEEFGKLIASKFELIRSLSDERRTLETVRNTLLPKLLAGSLQIPVEAQHGFD